MILNCYVGQHKYMVNQVTTTVKQYASKCLNVNPISSGFVTKLSEWFCIDKQMLLDGRFYKNISKLYCKLIIYYNPQSTVTLNNMFVLVVHLVKQIKLLLTRSTTYYLFHILVKIPQ